MGTGLEKSTCCQPEAVSPANVAVISSVPLLVQGLTTWVPVLVLGLVEADARNVPVHVRTELHPQLRRAVGPRADQAGDRLVGLERDNIANDDAQGRWVMAETPHPPSSWPHYMLR